MLDEKEIEVEIARLEYVESSYQNYAKLADLYIIRDQMNQSYIEDGYKDGYSYSTQEGETVDLYGQSEFLQSIHGKKHEKIFEIIDELMDTLKIVNHKAYRRVMQEIDRI